MKTETLLYDTLKKVLPKDAEKTILYACISETSREIFFYTMEKQGAFKQCFALAEEGILDENELDAVFSEAADILKRDSSYSREHLNVFTFSVLPMGAELHTKHFEKDARVYRIKKEWKKKYLGI